MSRYVLLIAAMGSGFIAGPTMADCLYGRSAWVAELLPGGHQAQGTVTIIDERTVQVENFTYDGLAPAVYFYLGETDSHQSFVDGIPIGPLLDRAYDNESLTLTLPPGETLEGYGAISVWCVEFQVSFTSAEFAPPAQTYPRAGWQAELSTLFHQVAGTVTIINERILFAEHFTFDGGGPAVYFYLGETDTQQAFIDGLELEPQLDRPYDDESLVLVLPDGETLDGYGAVSVWCAAVNVNFGSGEFLESICGDMNCDGELNGLDVGPFTLALIDPAAYEAMFAGCALGTADVNHDGTVDGGDVQGFMEMLLGG